MTSLHAGGRTFAENPDHSCAHVLPMWSAAMDPRVLTARTALPHDPGDRLFIADPAHVRILRAPDCEHLLVERGDEIIRLDVVDGTTAAGPVTLRFELADDDLLEAQIAALRALRAETPVRTRHGRLAGKLLALQAADAHRAGASLRETADLLLGPGDWPGDGEHRKSHVRRLLGTGLRMIDEGPRAILRLG